MVAHCMLTEFKGHKPHLKLLVSVCRLPVLRTQTGPGTGREELWYTSQEFRTQADGSPPAKSRLPSPCQDTVQYRKGRGPEEPYNHSPRARLGFRRAPVPFRESPPWVEFGPILDSRRQDAIQ